MLIFVLSGIEFFLEFQLQKKLAHRHGFSGIFLEIFGFLKYRLPLYTIFSYIHINIQREKKKCLFSRFMQSTTCKFWDKWGKQLVECHAMLMVLCLPGGYLCLIFFQAASWKITSSRVVQKILHFSNLFIAIQVVGSFFSNRALCS